MKRTTLKSIAIAISLILMGSLGVAAQTIAANAGEADTGDANSPRAQKVERMAMELLKNPIVIEATAKGLKSYKEGELSTKPEGTRYVQSAIDEVAALACTYAAMGVAPDPTFVWVFAAPRKWNGYTFPGTRWYADNVDTFYRAVRVEERSTYEINLKLGKQMASQVSFMLWDWLMFENGITESTDIPMFTYVIDNGTKRNADGTITLTFGPEPAQGRSNHIQFKPGVKQIFLREIRGNGAVPVIQLTIRRTKGDAPAAKTMDDLAKEAALYITAGVKGTHLITTTFGQLSENKISPIRIRWREETGSAKNKMSTDEIIGSDRAVGFIGSGLFNLKDDEALVMTLNMLGVEYTSLNTYRPFLVSPEHVYGSSSLNNYQAQPNPDGSFTFVIARKDPGLYNWVDVQGIPYGYFAIRWQSLTRPISATLANAVQMVKVVKLADLRKELPSTTKWVTEEERNQQRETRARNYKLRCLGTPCEVGGKLDRMY